MSKFTMLIGLPAAGKDTEVEKILSENEKTIVVSSDKIREELYGDESIQGDVNKVFNLVHKKIFEGLKNKKDVLYNATNLKSKHRRHLIGQIMSKFPDVLLVGRFVYCDYQEVLERNSKRERVVPETVIERMYKNFQPPYYDEGFDILEFVDSSARSVLRYRYNDLSVLRYRYNDLCDLRKIPHDNPNHTLSIGEHCIAAEKKGQELYEEWLNKRKYEVDKRGSAVTIDENLEKYLVKEVCLMHDFGKRQTKTFHNSKGELTEIAHYYRHENVSAYESFKYHCWNNAPLGYSEMSCCQYGFLLANLIYHHMQMYQLTPKLEAKLRLKFREYYKLLKLIHEADILAH